MVAKRHDALIQNVRHMRVFRCDLVKHKSNHVAMPWEPTPIRWGDGDAEFCTGTASTSFNFSRKCTVDFCSCL